MVAEFFHNEERHRAFLEELDEQYPFYCVLLYTPGNDVNSRLHEYVISHWSILNSLTGPNCLFMAIENIEPGLSIEQFKPEDVYNIARYLGASVDTIPGMVFYTEPDATKDTLILRIRDFFSEPSTLTDSDLTDFFQSILSIVDGCSRGRRKTAKQRLKCLSKGLDKAWPRISRWSTKANDIQNWLTSSSASTVTIASAIDKIHEVLQHLKFIG